MRILDVRLIGMDFNRLLTDTRLENLRQLLEMAGYGQVMSEGLDGFRIDVLERESPEQLWSFLARGQKTSAWVGVPGNIGAPKDTLIWVPGLIDADLSGMNLHSISKSLDDGTRTSLEEWSKHLPGADMQRRIFMASRAQFDVAKYLLYRNDWDYLTLVDTGMSSLLTQSVQSAELLDEYVLQLDNLLGDLLQHLNDEVVLLVVFQDRSPESTDLQSHPAPSGWFILASANNPLLGLIEAVIWQEIYPTLFELAGFPAFSKLVQKSLIASRAAELLSNNLLREDETALIRERLSGLGYLG